MMKNIQAMAIIFSFTSILSCSQKLTSVYYYDNTKIDDGEITAAYLKGFFVQDKNVHIYKVRSNVLNEELKKIQGSIKKVTPVDKFDDSYYGYAFITSEGDTLFSDYNLTYWRHNQKGAFYKTNTVKSIINKAIH